MIQLAVTPGKPTYDNVVNVKVDVDAEGHRDRDERHQFVQLDFTSLLPGKLLDTDPVWNLADEAFTLEMIVG